MTNIANLNPGLIGSNAFLYVLADTDGDKMPDSWEIEFGLNPTNSVDGTNDLDGDTMINRDEWIAGTDPMDPESYLKVDQIEASGGASLQFLAISNKSYTIQYTHSLESGDWTRLTDVKARTDTRVEVVVDPTPGVGRYYRLVTPKLPPP